MRGDDVHNIYVYLKGWDFKKNERLIGLVQSNSLGKKGMVMAHIINACGPFGEAVFSSNSSSLSDVH